MSSVTSRITPSTSVDRARTYFRQPQRYLRRNYRIALRSELVKELVGEVRECRILDLGCGDGSLSAQFLPARNEVTLVDFSDGMLQVARQRVPPAYAAQVEFVNADIFEFTPTVEYDLVLCIGVLAHVDAVDRAIEKVARCVRPGGRVVFQINDDASAVVRCLKRMYAVREALTGSSLKWKEMVRADVVASAERHGLQLIAERRHLLLLFPGMTRLLGRWLLPYDRFVRRHPRLGRHASNVIFVCRKSVPGTAATLANQSGR